jgi:hypothetical protein
MVEKEVEMSSTGELNFKIPQQEWTGNDAIQSSYFAGQEMFIKRSDEQPNEFELHYLLLRRDSPRLSIIFDVRSTSKSGK